MKRTVAVLLALFVMLAFASPVWADAPQATPTVAALNVRQGPGTNYQIISALRTGDSVSVTGRDAARGWYQVTLSDGRTGWISAALVQVSGDVASLPVAQAPAAPIASASTGHKIVFQISSGGPIYVANPDGTGLRQLTTGIDPAISPDGTQVAFTRWSGSNYGSPGNLWVINLDGSSERKVLTLDVAQPKSPSWSPDGRQIVIQYQQGGVVYPTNGCVGQGGQIPPDAVDIHTEDGKICFTVLAHPYWDLGLANLANGSLKQLAGDRYSFSPAWDPANAWHIVYHSYNGLTGHDINQGTNWQMGNDVNDRSPVFSPDGKRLAVTYRQGDHWEIHVMNADGSGEARITETSPTELANQILNNQTPRSWNNAAPAWSPDGSQLAFVTDRTGQWEIWIMNADGSNQHPLIPASALNGQAIQYNGVDERVISWK
jgi:dipeptidyl aminopeptidase/acylaminoacyl peptidase